MKKLTLAAIAIFALVFNSCDVEPAGSDSLESINGKGKLKKKAEKSESEESCIVDLLPELPSVVNACVTAKGPNTTTAYFDLTVNGESILAGNYEAWCTDFETALNEDQCFDGNVYSSYDVLPESGIAQPENFDLINWIVNQDFVGQASTVGGNYTYGDVQYAIWVLIDSLFYNCSDCDNLGDWDPDRAQEIIDLALANGDGYEPGIGDQLVVVLIPTDSTVQSVIISVPMECDEEPSTGGCETAFARGIDGNTCFIGEGFNRWGWSIGPLEEGTEETYDVYAGAGQCDINKGALVGTVDVSYVDGNVTVTYNIDDAYTVSETHTYAGTDMFPTKNGKPTVAPGQFTIEEDLEGAIYVIAHAVVCTDGDE